METNGLENAEVSNGPRAGFHFSLRMPTYLIAPDWYHERICKARGSFPGESHQNPRKKIMRARFEKWIVSGQSDYLIKILGSSSYPKGI